LGLVNLVIGNGAPVSPYTAFDFSLNTPWQDPSLTLDVEVDPSGSGTSYSLLSSTPMRAVPFAYFAKQAQESELSYYSTIADDAYFAYDAYMAYTLYSPYNDAVLFTNPSNIFSGNGSGLTNLSASNINSGMLSGQFGGTGVDVSSVVPGTMLYATSSGTWNIIPPGAQGQVLKMNAGVPTWSSESTAGRLVYNESISGTASNPTSTPGFITPVCTLTVSGGSQTVFVTSSICLYGLSPSNTPTIDGASLALKVKWVATGFEQILSSSFVTFVSSYDKRRFTFHGSVLLYPGTYHIGIEGFRSASSVGTVYGVNADQTVLGFKY
jgi:hypothetical protein